MKPPCGKVCPDRTIECKITCEKWAEYETWKFKQDEEKKKKVELETDYFNYLIHRVEKNRKMKR